MLWNNISCPVSFDEYSTTEIVKLQLRNRNNKYNNYSMTKYILIHCYVFNL